MSEEEPKLDETNEASLACDVRWQTKGFRPVIELHSCAHQLHFHQKNGIHWDRAIELAQAALHPQ